MISRIKPVDVCGGRLHPQSRRHLDLLAFMRKQGVPRDAAILDVGCGDGRFLRQLERVGYDRLAGADWLPPNRTDAPAYCQTDFNRDGLAVFADRSFDCLVCSDVLEHMENPTFLLREMARVARSEIFLTLPNAFNLFERLRVLWTGNFGRYRQEQPGGFGHVALLPSDVLASLLVRSGLRIEAQGRGFCAIGGRMIFPEREFGPLWSYVASYHLKHRERR